MKKFRTVLKKKQQKFGLVQEKKVLLSFKKVYNALLEKYGSANFNDLNKENQPAFLNELHSYWNEDKGLLEKGKRFLKGETEILNESSTSIQKKNYIRKRVTPLISETLRQSKLKWKMYDVVDEVYKGVKANKLSEVLSADELTDVILESFRSSLQDFMKEVQFELSENSKAK